MTAPTPAPTREEIERLADELIEPYGENISRRTKAADYLLDLLKRAEAAERRARRDCGEESARLMEELASVRKSWVDAEAALSEAKGQIEWLDRSLTAALTPKEPKP